MRVVVLSMEGISIPYSEKNNVDHPVSIYAASKKSNELMAHAYSHLYLLPATGLRFLLYMDHGGGLTCLIFYLQKLFLRIKPLTFLIMEI